MFDLREENQLHFLRTSFAIFFLFLVEFARRAARKSASGPYDGHSSPTASVYANTTIGGMVLAYLTVVLALKTQNYSWSRGSIRQWSCVPSCSIPVPIGDCILENGKNLRRFCREVTPKSIDSQLLISAQSANLAPLDEFPRRRDDSVSFPIFGAAVVFCSMRKLMRFQTSKRTNKRRTCRRS